MNRDVALPKVAGVEVGHWRRQALTEKEIADDIMRCNKGKACISFAAAARYIGVKEETAKTLLIDVPRRTVGQRLKINARDLARYLSAGMTFEV